MDWNVAACTFFVSQVVLSTIQEREPFTGVPCFIFYDRADSASLVRVLYWSGQELSVLGVNM
jgi:hypothetical protein